MRKEVLNTYGDHLVPTTGSHGADIASQRIDDLDRHVLTHLLSLSDPHITCVDLGCGFGWQGIRFATLGAASHLFDLLPEPHLINSLQQEGGLALSYTSVDLRAVSGHIFPPEVRLAFSQRFIHYLRYSEAEKLIELLARIMLPGAIFGISASGLASELGRGYVAGPEPLPLRYGKLSPQMQLKHDIREEVCLYTEADLTRLMTTHGFVAKRVWSSTFGNIKGVYERVG